MLDTLVIGAGQAGLAAGYHLKKTGRDFVIVDAAAQVGASWTQRYRSITLFTPRWFSALPDLTLEGDPEGYATGEEFGAYLARYAAPLPVRLNARVERLQQTADNVFRATMADGTSIDSRNVIVATGGFQNPVVPAFAHGLTIVQHTSSSYKDPSSTPAGAVLVVGDGASGRDIASELAATGRVSVLASGKERRLFPERILGVSTWWWLDRLGLLRAPTKSRIGRRMQAVDAFPDRNRSIGALRQQGVRIATRAIGGDGDVVSFADGTRQRFDAVVWCVGYRDDTDWLDIPGTSEPGRFLHCEGISPVTGLFYIGRPWQRNRASGLIMGVGDDARVVVGALR